MGFGYIQNLLRELWHLEPCELPGAVGVGWHFRGHCLLLLLRVCDMQSSEAQKQKDERLVFGDHAVYACHGLPVRYIYQQTYGNCILHDGCVDM